MVMRFQTTELNVTYFSYTFLEEIDLKRLILYFDAIQLLRVLPDFDLGLPDPMRPPSLVQSFCPISESSLHETIKRAYQTYQQLGSVHPDGGLVELLSTFALQEDVEHSRTGIVAHLRQAHPRLAPEEVELVNDAVFLLLAHKLDREHLELDLQLDRIRALEARLHQEVGIDADQETDLPRVESATLLETDRPRTQYPFQRLRAWTRLYCLQRHLGGFLPLTTNTGILTEISERLPSPLTGITGGAPAIPPEQYLLSILPDPQALSLEEILEFRQSLSRDSALDSWRESVTAAVNRLQQETLSEEQGKEFQQQLQKTADKFQQQWPASEKPAHYLRLEARCYPNLRLDSVFSIATGLQPHGRALPASEETNGITLLLAPTALPPGGRQ
jgi:hypothetical protein